MKVTPVLVDKDGNKLCELDPAQSPFSFVMPNHTGVDRKYVIEYTYKRDNVTKEKDFTKVTGIMLR